MHRHLHMYMFMCTYTCMYMYIVLLLIIIYFGFDNADVVFALLSGTERPHEVWCFSKLCWAETCPAKVNTGKCIGTEGCTGESGTGMMIWTIHVQLRVYTPYLLQGHVHDKSKKGKYIHPEQLSLFSKKKLLWVGFEPTTLRVLGERSTS